MTLIRSRPDPDTGQATSISQKLRFATCEEVDCELWREGKTFMQMLPPGHPARQSQSMVRFDPVSGMAEFHHPKGWPCGPQCPNDYCPCVNTGDMPGHGGFPHHVVDYGRDLAFGVGETRFVGDRAIVVPGTLRPAGESETLDRLAEGLETWNFANTRGF